MRQLLQDALLLLSSLTVAALAAGCLGIAELDALDCEVTDDRGIQYQHYSRTSQTNYVSLQRCRVRGTTVNECSGCPVFLMVGDKLVLLFSKHLGYRDVETWSPFGVRPYLFALRLFKTRSMNGKARTQVSTRLYRLISVRMMR